jgi:hypothetical protein
MLSSSIAVSSSSRSPGGFELDMAEPIQADQGCAGRISPANR